MGAREDDKEIMLKSVYSYLSSFVLKKEDNKEIDKIIDAMRVVDRKHFVKTVSHAYYDSALPIGEGQTISQPSTVARMIMLLDLDKGMSVLDVGSGSGWNAAILAYLAYPGKVLSIERIKEVSDNSKKNIDDFLNSLPDEKKLLFNNLKFKNDDFFKFSQESDKKFDRIIITAGLEFGKDILLEDISQRILNEGGKLICPHLQGPLMIFDKKDGKTIKSYTSENYAFVPLM